MSNLFRKKSIIQILDDQKRNADLVDDIHHPELKRHLGLRDLVGFGIAAIIGAGIFSTIGQASADGGPAVILLFIFTAITCGFAAFCYAEFASMVPVSGSAYTYSYVSFGELFAWIIGWALIMEYAVGNITVAISWSDYLTSLLNSMNINIPEWMTMDYLSAKKMWTEVTRSLQLGTTMPEINPASLLGYQAYESAPTIGGFHIVLDIPALLIIFFITWLVYRGIRESRNASNLMVLVKLAVVIFVIILGAFYVNTDHWNPFMPNGISGVLKGVSAVFFAYIGFDAISTTAEECKNPQRDLPRGMIYSIVICTILYIIIALVLTGMVSYDQLAVGDPLAFVFQQVGLKWISGVIAVSAIFAMASVLLVFQLGQPRIWMSMSRDGLLPEKFSKIHPKFGTPAFATIVTGFVVAIPSLFFNLPFVTDLCSIGTLFAFVLVCGGILMLQHQKDIPRGKFKTPYVNAKWLMPLLTIIFTITAFTKYKEETVTFFVFQKSEKSPSTFIQHLSLQDLESATQFLTDFDIKGFSNASYNLEKYLTEVPNDQYKQILNQIPVSQELKYISAWEQFKHKIPMYIFILSWLTLTVLSFMRNLSLIPVLGVVSCLYLMAQIPLKNWIGFGIWLVIGLMLYFAYGRKHSKLNTQNSIG